jgi:serpin B
MVVLPGETNGLPQLEAELTPTLLESWAGSLPQREVHVYLPRFRMTAEFELQRQLAKLGMGVAFQGGAADFSGLNGRRDLELSAVIHKAFVDVNEEGTEAAAATAVGVRLTAMPAPPPVFRADHPFLFLIRDHQTRSILFLGRVTNPKT